MGRARAFAVIFLVSGGVGSVAQSTLPVSSPTQLNPANSEHGVTREGVAATSIPQASQRAVVVFTGGQLTVTANNSSLNQILREISRQTGMVITGGVVDEHVFGSYGPASAGEVLSRLLDGTGSNMLLIAGPGGAPKKLILTSREGGASPPNPNAMAFDQDSRDDDRPAVEIRPTQRPIGGDERGRLGQPFAQPPAPQGSSQSSNTPGNGTSANGGASNPASPNGVLTPEQIYQQLQQLQRGQPQK